MDDEYGPWDLQVSTLAHQAARELLRTFTPVSITPPFTNPSSPFTDPNFTDTWVPNNKRIPMVVQESTLHASSKIHPEVFADYMELASELLVIRKLTLQFGGF
jgi:hypothetical protein